MKEKTLVTTESEEVTKTTVITATAELAAEETTAVNAGTNVAEMPEAPASLQSTELLGVLEPLKPMQAVQKAQEVQDAQEEAEEAEAPQYFESEQAEQAEQAKTQSAELPETQPAQQTEPQQETEETENLFSIPLSSLNTINKLTHLISELYTYSYLLNKATGAELFIDNRMCDDLAEAISFDEFLGVFKEFLNMTTDDYIKGLELKKEQLVFTCFQNLTDTGMKKASGMLVSLISKSITENVGENKKRVNLHNDENQTARE